MSKTPGVFNVAVEAVIVKNGKILITRRSLDRDHAPGEWETLTGRVDQGETFEEALLREVWEEVKLKVKIVKPFHTFHFYRGKEKAEVLGVSFICKYAGGRINLKGSEQIAFKWATLDEAEKLITDKSVLNSIEKLRKYLS